MTADVVSGLTKEVGRVGSPFEAPVSWAHARHASFSPFLHCTTEQPFDTRTASQSTTEEETATETPIRTTWTPNRHRLSGMATDCRRHPRPTHRAPIRHGALVACPRKRRTRRHRSQSTLTSQPPGTRLVTPSAGRMYRRERVSRLVSQCLWS